MQKIVFVEGRREYLLPYYYPGYPEIYIKEKQYKENALNCNF